MYRISINGNTEDFSSLMTLIKYFVDEVANGDMVEIYEKQRTRWKLVDGCVWGVR